MLRSILLPGLFALCASACVDNASATTQASTGSDTAGSADDHRTPPLPPKEAFEACASSTENATCAFDIDGHHVTGTCSHGPDGQGPLACKPDQPPPPPPPPRLSA